MRETGAVPVFLPDPIYAIEALSGAAFLYFDAPFVFTLVSPVVTTDSYHLLDELPDAEWADRLRRTLGVRNASQAMTMEVQETLSSLQPDVKLLWLSYPAGLDALEGSRELLSTVEMSPADFFRDCVDQVIAAGEVIRHIFLERWVELGEDTRALAAYCEETFATGRSATELLTLCYLFRVQALGVSSVVGTDSALLTNPRLTSFLLRLAARAEAPEQPDIAIERDAEVAGWEVFKRIVDAATYPLTTSRVESIANCRLDRSDAVDALKKKSAVIATELAAFSMDDLADLERKLTDVVRMHAEDEIAAVLQLSDAVKRDFLERLVSDRASWTAAISAVSGIISGGELLTTVGAIGALATAAAHGAGAIVKGRRDLHNSPYRLVYYLNR